MRLNEINELITREARAFFSRETPRLVFGEGQCPSSVMLVGEAPGRQEELIGRPFVGQAGKNLDAFLELPGIDRSGLYITNTVKFRPTKLSPAGNTVNRAPTGREVDFFLKYLLMEIEAAAPRVIVTLGNTPLQALMGKRLTIGEVHGQRLSLSGRELYPLYHPASVIYNRALGEVYRTDVVRLGEILRREKP